MDQAVRRGVDARPPGRGRLDPLPPPRRVHRAVAALQQAQPDLGDGREQALADEASARILDRHEAGLGGVALDVAAIDPGMSPNPALGAARRDPGRGHARSGRRTVAPRR